MGLPGADLRLLLLANHARTPVLDRLMPVLSDPAPWAVPLAVFLAWRLWRGGAPERLWWAGCILTVVLTDALVARILKPLIARPRPYLEHDGIWILKGGRWLLTDPALREALRLKFGWPSAHAANLGAAAAYLSLAWPRRAWAFWIPALLVSYSRLYLGVHYPSDVAGGLLLGLLLGILGARLARALGGRPPGSAHPEGL